MRRSLAVIATLGVLAAGAGCATHSIEGVMRHNGFSDPIERLGDGKYEVGFGNCRITVKVVEPWYETYQVDYLPADNNPPVKKATADKLSQLPESYKLDVCVPVVR